MFNTAEWITLSIFAFTNLGLFTGTIVRFKMKQRELELRQESLRQELIMQINSNSDRIRENRSDMNSQYISHEKAMDKLEKRMDNNFDELFKKMDRISDYLLKSNK